MKKGIYSENECLLAFSTLGECYHLWTPENFGIIFTCDEDFMDGMGMIAVCARSFPDLTVLTFQIMSNHIHITVAGPRSRILEMFKIFAYMLARFVRKAGRTFDLPGFLPGLRKIEQLEDLRNVIVYNNRNGYLVNPEHSPYTYPWGANKYYFNRDAKKLAGMNSGEMTLRERRRISHSRMADGVRDLKCFEGYALPLSFCDIDRGEQLFHSASHYFYKLSRSIESNKQIAKEIGESVFYTDDELYSAIIKVAKNRFGTFNLSEIRPEGKIELAKLMRYDYNASAKQITRMLKLPIQTLAAIGFNSASD